MASRRGRGEGSIAQRSDGRWMARVDLGFVDGRRLWKQFYASTRKLVAKKLNDAIGCHQRGAIVATNDQLTTNTYLDQWLHGPRRLMTRAVAYLVRR